MRRLYALVLIVLVVFGAAYAAAMVTRIVGPFTATAVEADGSQTHMVFHTDLPRPAWVPFYPGATVVQGSRLVSAKMPSGVQSLDLATRASLDGVKRFYTAELTAAGFEVTDLGTLSLNPATAWMLGIAGMMSASRAATDDRIDIQIRTPDGLIPSRLLQISWRKISEFPLMPPQVAARRTDN